MPHRIPETGTPPSGFCFSDWTLTDVSANTCLLPRKPRRLGLDKTVNISLLPLSGWMCFKFRGILTSSKQLLWKPELYLLLKLSAPHFYWKTDKKEKYSWFQLTLWEMLYNFQMKFTCISKGITTSRKLRVIITHSDILRMPSQECLTELGQQRRAGNGLVVL